MRPSLQRPCPLRPRPVPGTGGVPSRHGRRRAARSSVRRGFYPRCMANSPSRIDLLELDIDLRLADLWREAADISEWNIEVVAAFMRAAYGKGYCDALTEDAPGSLCHDHGYRIPGRRPAPAHEG
jgi:hypothetical protein